MKGDRLTLEHEMRIDGEFQSPCGEMVLKASAELQMVKKSALKLFVSIPLRGDGFESLSCGKDYDLSQLQSRFNPLAGRWF